MATEWLDDVFGPDGIRVNVAVEPAVQRLVRATDQWTTQRFSVMPARLRLRNLLPGVIQQRVLSDSWSVVIEADSGQRLRLSQPTRDEARALAETVANAVRHQGVPALTALQEPAPKQAQ